MHRPTPGRRCDREESAHRRGLLDAYPAVLAAERAEKHAAAKKTANGLTTATWGLVVVTIVLVVVTVVAP